MRRFVECRNKDEMLVLDLKDPSNPLIVCRCDGYYGSLKAEYVANALEAQHQDLLKKVMGDVSNT